MNESHLIHKFDLLSRYVRSVLEGHRTVGRHFRDVGEPHLEESDFNEYQLIVLRQIAETWYPFGEFDDPLHRRRYSRGELLPQPDSL